MSSVLRRTLTGAGLALGVTLLLIADRQAPPGLVPWLAAALLSCLGAHEAARMSGSRPAYAALLVPGLLLALLAAPLAGGPLLSFATRRDVYPLALFSVALLAAGIVLACARRQGARAPLPAGYAAFLAAWILPALYGLAWIDATFGIGGVVFLIVVSKIGDVFGYFVGRAIGVRRPFPRVSPNKTVAGCVASLLAGIAAGLACAALGWPLTWRGGLAGGALAGLALNLAAQAGDLLKSRVKRRFGVKDSGKLFGPAGGVLDVVDSLLATTPLALVLLPGVL